MAPDGAYKNDFHKEQSARVFASVRLGTCLDKRKRKSATKGVFAAMNFSHGFLLADDSNLSHEPRRVYDNSSRSRGVCCQKAIGDNPKGLSKPDLGAVSCWQMHGANPIRTIFRI